MCTCTIQMFIPCLNVWQAMMLCAICLFELIKKCLILSYLIVHTLQSAVFLSDIPVPNTCLTLSFQFTVTTVYLSDIPVPNTYLTLSFQFTVTAVYLSDIPVPNTCLTLSFHLQLLLCTCLTYLYQTPV